MHVRMKDYQKNISSCAVWPQCCRWLQDTSKRILADFSIFYAPPPPPSCFPGFTRG